MEKLVLEFVARNQMTNVSNISESGLENAARFPSLTCGNVTLMDIIHPSGKMKRKQKTSSNKKHNLLSPALASCLASFNFE